MSLSRSGEWILEEDCRTNDVLHGIENLPPSIGVCSDPFRGFHFGVLRLWSRERELRTQVYESGIPHLWHEGVD